MNKVLKKALGFASALVLMAVMVLAASPVQASDVDTRIQALERELAQLKQNQESALAAEMMVPTAEEAAAAAKAAAAADAAAKAEAAAKAAAAAAAKAAAAAATAAAKPGDVTTKAAATAANAAKAAAAEALATKAAARAAMDPPMPPSFSYGAGKGLTIAAADNNWSIKFTQRLQVYHSIWLSNEDPEAGYQNLELRPRRFRPTINVSSQQGFYAVTWLLNKGGDGETFGGDGYINFDKLNPWLPSFGWGYSPSFAGNTQAGAFRTEDAPLLDGLAIGGQQDGSFVLSWTKLPGMGISKISHLQLAWGQDNQAEASTGDDGNSVGFALGLNPLAQAEGMGGLSISSLSYSFGYQNHTDTTRGVSATATVSARPPTLISIGAAKADHTYMSHGVGWSPLQWLSLSANYATYERETGGSVDVEATDVRLAAQVWLWGPKSGMMGGSKSEGGISVAPLYSAADVDYDGGSSDVTNTGVAVVYNVPGGWMQIHGVFDTYGCEGACPGADFAAVAEDGDDSFNVFTMIIEYKF